MRATVMHGAGDVRIETVADARLIEPTDALVTVSRAAVCGGDLWPYNQMDPGETSQRRHPRWLCVVALHTRGQMRACLCVLAFWLVRALLARSPSRFCQRLASHVG